MYETSFGPLGKSTGRTIGLADICCFFRELVALLNYKNPFPHLLLHAYLKPWHAPRLLELRESCNLERIVSLKEFFEDEPLSLLGFQVTLAYLTFLALFHFLIYVLMSFPKRLLIISLKVSMFLKEPL
jgi:hypothetical protein